MRLFTLFFLIIFSTVIFAETLYVSGAPSIMLYDAPNSNANVLVKLSQGTPVELLKTNLENGYSFVRTDKQEKGWVETLFLSTDMPVNPTPNFFMRAWGSFKNIFVSSQKKEQPTHSTQSMVLPTSVQNVANNIDLSSLQKQIETLQQMQHRNRYWFFAGALMMLIGFLMGFWISNFKNRRRSRWY